MVEPAEPDHRAARPPASTGLLLLVGGLALVVGAVLDWILWLPTQGIFVTLAGAVLVAAGIVLAFVQRPALGRFAAFAVVAGAALVLGQTIGPSRGNAQVVDGEMAVTVGDYSGGYAKATCSVVDGEDLLVESSTFIPFLSGREPDTLDQAPSVEVRLARGSAWTLPGAPQTEDGLAVLITVTAAHEPSDGTAPRLQLTVDPDFWAGVDIGHASGSVGWTAMRALSGNLGDFGIDRNAGGSISWTCELPIGD